MYVRPLASGCWEWVGSCTRKGYGMMSGGVDGNARQAHRAMFEIRHNRELQPFETLDHRCRNRVCCNPDHLDVVTSAENTKRMHAYQSMVGEIEHLRSEVERVNAENAILRSELKQATTAHDVASVRAAVVAPRAQIH